MSVTFTKLIKKFQNEADDKISPKRIEGGLYAFYNIKPNDDIKTKKSKVFCK